MVLQSPMLVGPLGSTGLPWVVLVVVPSMYKQSPLPATNLQTQSIPLSLSFSSPSADSVDLQTLKELVLLTFYLYSYHSYHLFISYHLFPPLYYFERCEGHNYQSTYEIQVEQDHETLFSLYHLHLLPYFVSSPLLFLFWSLSASIKIE